MRVSECRIGRDQLGDIKCAEPQHVGLLTRCLMKAAVPAAAAVCMSVIRDLCKSRMCILQAHMLRLNSTLNVPKLVTAYSTLRVSHDYLPSSCGRMDPAVLLACCSPIC